jgi:hypothetical protein
MANRSSHEGYHALYEVCDRGYDRPMDEWRTRLAEQLLSAQDPSEGDRPTVEGLARVSGPTAMEIAFGKARSELTYVLEFGRAHHLPIVGNVVGDDVWIRLGETKLGFHLDRPSAKITATVVGEDASMTWDAKSRAIVMSSGKAIDVEWFVRDAIDATVRAWKGAPASLSDTSANPIANMNADQTLEMPTIPGDDAKE